MRRWRARFEMLPADELMRSRWADREMWWVYCRQVCSMSGAGSREGEDGRARSRQHTQTQTESDGPCPHVPEYLIKQRFLPFGLLYTHKLGLIYWKTWRRQSRSLPDFPVSLSVCSLIGKCELIMLCYDIVACLSLDTDGMNVILSIFRKTQHWYDRMETRDEHFCWQLCWKQLYPGRFCEELSCLTDLVP